MALGSLCSQVATVPSLTLQQASPPRVRPVWWEVSNIDRVVLLKKHRETGVWERDRIEDQGILGVEDGGPEEDIGSPGAGVTCVCELPNKGGENQILVLWKSSECS